MKALKEDSTKPEEEQKGFINEHSENIAGLFSFIGSSIVATNGDSSSIASAIQLTASEILYILYGKKSWGFSLGCGLAGTGVMTLAFSEAAMQGGDFQQYSLLAMGGGWLVGSLKYPFEKAAKYIKDAKLSHFFEKCASITQPLTGYIGTGLKIPGMASVCSAKPADPVLITAMSLWTLATILAGRLQEHVPKLLKI